MNLTVTIPIQKLPSSRLFFKKYVYKIEGRYPKAHSIIYYLRHIPNYQGSDNFGKSMKQFIHRDDLKIRVENNTFGIYTNDLKTVNEISQGLGQYIKNIFGPPTEAEKDFLLNQSRKKIVRDQYPHKRYKFKVYFKTNWLTDWNSENKRQTYAWLQPYITSGRARLTKDTTAFLCEKMKWVGTPICYFENEKDLAMFLMFLTDRVLRVEEFVLRSDINDLT